MFKLASSVLFLSIPVWAGVCSAQNPSASASAAASSTIPGAAASSTVPGAAASSTTSGAAAASSTGPPPNPPTDSYGCQEGNIAVDTRNQSLFVMLCNASYSGNQIVTYPATNMTYCIAYCDETAGCVAATLAKQESECLLFSNIYHYGLGYSDFDSALLLKGTDPGPYPQ